MPSTMDVHLRRFPQGKFTLSVTFGTSSYFRNL